MTGDSPAAAKMSSLISAMSDTMEDVFKDEMPTEEIGFVIVGLNRKTGECGYVSNIQDIRKLMDLMKATVERFEQSEEAVKH